MSNQTLDNLEVSVIEMDESLTVKVNWNTEMNLEDLGDLAEDSKILEYASFIVKFNRNGDITKQASRVLRRINYLFYNTGYYLKRDVEFQNILNKDLYQYNAYKVMRYQ